MKNKIIITFALIGTLITGNVYAWASVNDARVTEFIQFNEGIARDYTVLKVTDSTGVSILCNVPYAEKNLTSLVLSLYMAGKKATYHCYDETLDVGGYLTHRLHRVIAK